jgi:hypothetical protein
MWDTLYINMDAVELRIALIDHLIILVLKYPLPEASQDMHQSAANNKIAEAVETFWPTCIWNRM